MSRLIFAGRKGIMAKTSPSKSKPTATRTKRAARKATSASANPKPKTTKSTAKAPAAKKAAPARETVKTLREHVDSIDTRLKRANTLTRKSVKSLETAFGVMEKRLKDRQLVDQDALNQKVSQLSHHLTATVEVARKEIASDLRSAASSRDMEVIETALARARIRLDEAELTQAEALTRVNKHIADLAKAIDERLREDSTRQQQGLHALGDKVDTHHAKVTLRINKIEDASADAIRKLGDQIVALTTDMQGRVDQSTASIRDKVSDIGSNTQNAIEDLRRKLERRLESVEEAQKNLDSYSDRMISTVNTRLDSLEYGLVAASPAAAIAHDGDVDTSTIAQAMPLDDPFAPTEAPVAEVVELMTPQPVYQAVNPVAAAHAAPEAFGPVEYVPEPYVPAAAYPQAEPYAAADPYTAPAPAYTQAVTNQTGGEFTPYNPATVSDSELPYDNPAYAETDTQNRPGHVSSDTGGKKILGLTPRNLRVAGLGVAVAALGYFAINSFTGGEPQKPATQQAVQQVTSEPQSAPDLIQPITPGIETTETVGDYADNRGTPSGEPIEAGQSLEVAADAGNPVAEFQLGIAYLDAGRTEEGLALVRSAANKDQPAAQYRLAKLYETGQGVAADPNMARQLTERAARNGNRIAMHDLALYYAEGRGGVETDITTAASWFEKAADRGVVDSQFNLGVLFESGQGVPQNLVDAYVWYSIAASQGDQFARERRDIIKANISEADLTRANERASAFAPAKIDEAANGIFRDLPWAVSEATTTSPTTSLVKDTQELLTSLGYDLGTPDGAMGPKTKTAIIEFQRSVGLVETGEVTAALVDRLEIAAGT